MGSSHELVAEQFENLETLFNTSPDAIVLHDAAGTIIDVNERVVEALDHTREDLTAMAVSDIEVGHTSAQLESLWAEMELDNRETVEGRHRRADGSTFPVEYSIRKTELDGDVRFLSLCRDVTERKQRENELRLKTRAMDEAPIGITISDATSEDNPLMYVNDRFTELTGYRSDEIIGRNCRFLQGENTDSETVARLVEGIRAEEPVTVELRNYRKDGTEFWNRVTVAPIFDDDGTVTNYVGFQEDVTERKQAETERARTRNFLDSVIEAVPYPLYVLDVEDYEIELANSRANVEKGDICYEATHQRDRPCHEGDGETFDCPLAKAVQTGEPATVEHTHYVNGSERIHEVHAAPVLDDDGTVVSLVESIIDVTDQREYEQQLTEQRDNLDILNQVLRHDVRNDLQLVTAYAEMLEDSVDESNQGYVETIKESATHATELTTTARDMADVMLTEDDVQQPVNLQRVLEDTLDEVRSAYSEADITVDGTLPAIEVLASDMLDSVFRNLLKNAIQHNDTPVPAVTLSVTTQDELARVRIADNGSGVPDSQKDEIFGKGQKGLDSTGTGIGLYLVDTLVETYGGDVWVEDNDPEGAVFVVELPTA